MNKARTRNGNGKSFNDNWVHRRESYYNHWTRKKIVNQIQFAFRNHWEVMKILMENPLFNKGKRILEVGCGRGSISCYFSDAGFDCTLLDLSETAVGIASKVFAQNRLKGKFTVGDVTELPFKDRSFDLVVSIGLLEHFEQIAPPLKEQIRILDSGGMFLGYVVPEYSNNLQQHYRWINDLLKGYSPGQGETPGKSEIFRSGKGSGEYIAYLKTRGLIKVQARGVYPLPLISHSIEFPFSLMPEQSERRLVEYFEGVIDQRGKTLKKHPWFCREGYGQAFLVWGYK